MVPGWLQQLELAGEDEANDELKTEAERDQLVRAVDFQAVLTGAEDRTLAEMVAWGRRHGDRPDAKAHRLIQLLTETCRPGGVWNQERIVVFTESRDTQRWLAELLGANALGGRRLQLLFGGQDETEREQIKNAFQAPPERSPVRILLATDAAGEGIDLQLHCHRVVNYDIPFNPNRLEQRIGRIDRHGQRYPPIAYHFVGAGWETSQQGSYERDLEFLSRVATKVAAQEDDLGAVNSVLEKAIQRHMTGDGRPIDVSTRKVTTSAQALKAERDLRERIDQLSERLQQSIDDLNVRPANLERAVHTALALARQPSLGAGSQANGASGLFQMPPLTGTWARALAGIADPLSGDPRPITFDPGRANANQDVVLIHLGHPLLSMSTRLLRAAIWGSEHGGLHRVAACRRRDPNLEATLLVAFSRLVLVGADGVRLHEEVFPAGGWLRDGRFMALGVTRLRELVDPVLASPSLEPVTAIEQARLAREWQQARPALTTAMSNRAGERERSLRGRLDALRDDEIRRLRQAIDQFRRTLEGALRDPDDVRQMELQLEEPDELEQLRRDVHGWRATLARLEDQEQEEVGQIERRYSEARALTFPAAILFVVPERGR